MNNQYKYMVCTRCVTYNHAPYIEDALLGFVMQETTFPVVYVIIDDASTDGEPEIIRNFLSKHFDKPYREEENTDAITICARHKSNLNCEFVVTLLKYNHYCQKKGKQPYLSDWQNKSKYTALCEGDDYWMHPLKLQRQVDFMETHPDYTMCFQNAIVTYDDSDRVAKLFNTFGKDREVSLEELLDNWINPTASILARTSVPPVFPVKGDIISGDWRYSLHLAVCGKIWAMKAVMSCYRQTDLPTSMSNTYAHKADEAHFKKITILEGLDEYTEGKYHRLIGKYIRYHSRMGKLIAFKRKHGLLITCLLRPFPFIWFIWDLYLRHRMLSLMDIFRIHR